MTDNPLLDYFVNNEKRQIHKWMHYFEIYDRHLAVFRDTRPVVLEFGVSHGGSLQMWKDYFGEGARIIGVDTNRKCKAVEEAGIEVFIGDQQKRSFLRKLAESIGPVQVLIDDGGHRMKQLIRTFEELYPSVTMPGVYIAEDLHTSYWNSYGGGLHKKGSFIEYSKRLIDRLNAWHYSRKFSGRPTGQLEEVDDFTRSAWSMHYYDSMLVIEKRVIDQPEARISGNPSF